MKAWLWKLAGDWEVPQTFSQTHSEALLFVFIVVNKKNDITLCLVVGDSVVTGRDPWVRRHDIWVPALVLSQTSLLGSTLLISKLRNMQVISLVPFKSNILRSQWSFWDSMKCPLRADDSDRAQELLTQRLFFLTFESPLLWQCARLASTPCDRKNLDLESDVVSPRPQLLLITGVTQENNLTSLNFSSLSFKMGRMPFWLLVNHGYKLLCAIAIRGVYEFHKHRCKKYPVLKVPKSHLISKLQPAKQWGNVVIPAVTGVPSLPHSFQNPTMISGATKCLEYS